MSTDDPTNISIERGLGNAKVSIPGFSQDTIRGITKVLQLENVPLVIQRHSASGRTPLFLIHDGSGLTHYYFRMSSLARPVWAINNPRFTSSLHWDNLTEMAKAYAEYIKSVTSGPILIGGWSFGGVAAYEVSLQLANHGVIVKGIILIDSPSPINHTPIPDSVMQVAANLTGRSAQSEVGQLVKNQFASNSRLLDDYKPHAYHGYNPSLVFLRCKEGYNPPNLSGVPLWLSDRSNHISAITGWMGLTQRAIKVIDIPGNHFTPFHALHIGEVSERLMDACNILDCHQI